MHPCPYGPSFLNLALCLKPVLARLAFRAALRAAVGRTVTSNEHCPSRC